MLNTVATFTDQPRAELARGRLLNEGVEASLKDHHIVGINWLFSVAVRGVKLQVAEANSAKAVSILSEDYAELLEEETSGTPLQCPVCGSRMLTAYSSARFIAALTLFPFWAVAFVIGMPFTRWEASWRCLSCKRTW